VDPVETRGLSTRKTVLLSGAIAVLSQLACGAARAAPADFNGLIDEVRARPAFAHAQIGIEVYSLDRRAILYDLHGDLFFVAASTTKLLTEGAALQLLGPDFRFHTPVYRTGEIAGGTLDGNLVLVGAGDPNLSGRRQPDGTLAFVDEDHSYGGYDARLVGDPLAALKEIARQIAESGVREVKGRVLVDASLFPEGEAEGGTGMIISPVVVNDNALDMVVAPGTAPGQPASVLASPRTPYITVIDKVTTGAPESATSLDTSAETLADGTLRVTESGSIPAQKGPYVDTYAVPSPSRYAAALLTQLLQAEGVKVDDMSFPDKPTGDAFKAWYTPQDRVADHVSAPLSEDVEVTLKVSQNLHAALMPYVIGAYVGEAKEKVAQAGFSLEHHMLARAGLDLSAASQGDGPGATAMFTPDFMVRYLAFRAAQPEFAAFREGLPVLGRDGTLWDIQKTSPAAGRVFAKTGTFSQSDRLNHSLTLTAKALAGYTTTPSGERVAFAIYINNVPLNVNSDDALAVSDAVTGVGQTVGEIAAGINRLPITPEK
jgi:D-alanyl-D-alanine carboxypeptidase/D-alanyl-D-alanine-endopeptidase (penicillin-binding protein 4)